MNDRKQRVIQAAHQLFIEKGFQATSIQDILDNSGISKGTFYNYFPSKNELLIALITSIYKQLELERNELLVGKSHADREIFIKQLELHLKTNRANKLLYLFDEIMVSNDPVLKDFLKKNRLKSIDWLFQRFTDVFGEDKKTYLLDCAIMFMGMLQQNLKFNHLAYGPKASIHGIVRYSVERISHVVEEVSKTNEQLLDPILLEKWNSDRQTANHDFQQKLYLSIIALKKAVHKTNGENRYIELLDFIEGELSKSSEPREFLIESVLHTLDTFLRKDGNAPALKELEQLSAVILSNSSSGNG
ncbi:TetR/AcrR family transcriptional regulator [Neobacillus notoginsengisoli]|uniref:TetR/AcrR family transcriptional regulator n=1 Tax=Neobacillus notoginsengisoli TaxID=1578198 RepID=A0A417YWA7_9BACI|nr:TetR/AcrR family transcriptional regulator [Neobacillus notoginsengisoli]RHW41699.1 TetR/AcrR family transcriptional regulator [Neobacillus notoginsengisoli]